MLLSRQSQPFLMHLLQGRSPSQDMCSFQHRSHANLLFFPPLRFFLGGASWEASSKANDESEAAEVAATVAEVDMGNGVFRGRPRLRGCGDGVATVWVGSGDDGCEEVSVDNEVNRGRVVVGVGFEVTDAGLLLLRITISLLNSSDASSVLCSSKSSPLLTSFSFSSSDQGDPNSAMIM